MKQDIYTFTFNHNDKLETTTVTAQGETIVGLMTRLIKPMSDDIVTTRLINGKFSVVITDVITGYQESITLESGQTDTIVERTIEAANAGWESVPNRPEMFEKRGSVIWPSTAQLGTFVRAHRVRGYFTLQKSYSTFQDALNERNGTRLPNALSPLDVP